MVVANGGGAASRRGTLGAAGDRGERAWLGFPRGTSSGDVQRGLTTAHGPLPWLGVPAGRVAQDDLNANAGLYHNGRAIAYSPGVFGSGAARHAVDVAARRL